MRPLNLIKAVTLESHSHSLEKTLEPFELQEYGFSVEINAKNGIQIARETITTLNERKDQINNELEKCNSIIARKSSSSDPAHLLALDALFKTKKTEFFNNIVHSLEKTNDNTDWLYN